MKEKEEVRSSRLPRRFKLHGSGPLGGANLFRPALRLNGTANSAPPSPLATVAPQPCQPSQVASPTCPSSILRGEWGRACSEGALDFRAVPCRRALPAILHWGWGECSASSDGAFPPLGPNLVHEPNTRANRLISGNAVARFSREWLLTPFRRVTTMSANLARQGSWDCQE